VAKKNSKKFLKGTVSALPEPKKEKIRLGSRDWVGSCLPFEKPIVDLEKKINELKAAGGEGIDLSGEIKSVEKKLEKALKEIFNNLTPWQRVQVARHPARPYTLDYIQYLTQDFVELHGDRHFSDDRAIIAGFAKWNGSEPVCVIGHQKGRDTKENLLRSFGSAHPEGYRKALRVMRLAEKFGRPILCFVDTPGAYPGIGAEERGQAEAIAYNLQEMATLTVPVVVIVIGEGGSGGALALAVGNRVLMLEHSVYSVISPEGCAAILWKKNSTEVGQEEYEKSSDALKLTAQDLYSLGIIDEIIPEPTGGAHRDYQETAKAIEKALKQHLDELLMKSVDELVEERYMKFRLMGKVEEES